jgi:FkbM family methyltransferase
MSLSELIKKIRQKIRVIPYFRADGENTLRLDYDLDEDSIVFDIGGYEGRWAQDIFSRYRCHIHIFEPVPAFDDNIRKRFSGNDKIVVHQFGLGKTNSNVEIFLSQDGSSLFKKTGIATNIKLVKLGDFFSQNQISSVDLMKINIEGGEYDLLEELIDTGLVTRVKNIQVQFHDFVPKAEKRMRKIQDSLRQTHTLTYQFKFVWENWKLK